jgi:hypothetical protein
MTGCGEISSVAEQDRIKNPKRITPPNSRYRTGRDMPISSQGKEKNIADKSGYQRGCLIKCHFRKSTISIRLT